VLLPADTHSALSLARRLGTGSGLATCLAAGRHHFTAGHDRKFAQDTEMTSYTTGHESVTIFLDMNHSRTDQGATVILIQGIESDCTSLQQKPYTRLCKRRFRHCHCLSASLGRPVGNYQLRQPSDQESGFARVAGSSFCSTHIMKT
jgi:hypothetical protein